MSHDFDICIVTKSPRECLTNRYRDLRNGAVIRTQPEDCCLSISKKGFQPIVYQCGIPTLFEKVREPVEVDCIQMNGWSRRGPS
jgi:hypothetical protein